MSKAQPVHPAAAAGFSAMAEAYAAGRPDYPPGVIDWLGEDVGLAPGKSALDLGAGTDKSLPFLRATGASLTAVEPIAAMRRLIADHPDVEALEGAAERIPLPDASLDAIVCAQPFRWFATRAALAEMRRVLKVGVAMVSFASMTGTDAVLEDAANWHRPRSLDCFAPLAMTVVGRAVTCPGAGAATLPPSPPPHGWPAPFRAVAA